MNTTEQTQTALRIVHAVAEVIRELGSVPSGHLYANLAGQMTLDTYNQIISVLKRADLIKEEAHVLTWIRPVRGESKGLK